MGRVYRLYRLYSWFLPVSKTDRSPHHQGEQIGTDCYLSAGLTYTENRWVGYAGFIGGHYLSTRMRPLTESRCTGCIWRLLPVSKAALEGE